MRPLYWSDYRTLFLECSYFVLYTRTVLVTTGGKGGQS